MSDTTLEARLVALLLADAAVAALVGDRIYPSVLKHNCPLPAIRYVDVSTEPIVDLEGPTDTERTTIQVDCYSATKATARTLAKAVAAALRTSTTFSSLPTGRRSEYDSNALLYVVSADFDCWNQE